MIRFQSLALFWWWHFLARAEKPERKKGNLLLEQVWLGHPGLYWEVIFIYVKQKAGLCFYRELVVGRQRGLGCTELNNNSTKTLQTPVETGDGGRDSEFEIGSPKSKRHFQDTFVRATTNIEDVACTSHFHLTHSYAWFKCMSLAPKTVV